MNNIVIPDSPWDREPDDFLWRDFATGYQCCILRHPQLGHLCGYVRVPSKHPYYRRYYRFDQNVLLKVHGGLTFCGRLNGKSGWWFGYDCGHMGDYSPGLVIFMGAAYIDPRAGIYRNFHYNWLECGKLALQLNNLET